MEERDAAATLARVGADVRAWFGGVPVTVGTVALLLCWHALLPWVAGATGTERFGTLFVARASPSPGWLLAALSHAGTSHLLANVLLLVVWGSISEHALGARRYASLLAITGVAGILAQVAQYVATGVPGGIVGASGATQAATAFATIALARGRGPFRTREMRYGALAGAASVVLLQLLNDFARSLTVVPEASGVAHLTGIALGLVAGLAATRRPAPAEPPT